MRVGGLQLLLTWDAFLYTVIIESFEADYRSPWWIPYRLSCSVLRDEAAAIVTAAVALAPAIATDLAAAGSLATLSAAAIGAPGATTAGTAAYKSATATLNTNVASLDAQIATAEPAIQANDIPTAITACGLLAQLTAARAYTARAARNLADAST